GKLPRPWRGRWRRATAAYLFVLARRAGRRILTGRILTGRRVVVGRRRAAGHAAILPGRDLPNPPGSGDLPGIPGVEKRGEARVALLGAGGVELTGQLRVVDRPLGVAG